MTVGIIQDRLNQYQCVTALDEENAIKEITQEIALLALSRRDFFQVAEFHGGTALRILYGLQRFSEDLDFALLSPNTTFNFVPYIDELAEEFREFGYDLEIQDRSKANANVRKAFLKDNSIGKVLDLNFPLYKRNPKKIQIKLELDVNPPEGALTEIKYLDFPLPYSILAKNLPSSFSGKLHAILCRSYLKGRDWYDFIWYVSRSTQINYNLLENAIRQNGPWQGSHILVNKLWLLDQLTKKIESIEWEEAKQDVTRFLNPIDQEGLKVWNKSFFLSRVEKLEQALF